MPGTLEQIISDLNKVIADCSRRINQQTNTIRAAYANRVVEGLNSLIEVEDERKEQSWDEIRLKLRKALVQIKVALYIPTRVPREKFPYFPDFLEPANFAYDPDVSVVEDDSSVEDDSTVENDQSKKHTERRRSSAEQLYESLIVKEEEESSDQIETQMAEFDLRTANGFESLESVEIKKINDFIAVAEFYYNTLTAAGKRTYLKFLTTCKIKGQAKTRFGDPEGDIATFEELKSRMSSNVAATETVAKLQGKLMALRQNRKTVDEFADQLNELSERLVAATLKEQENPSAETIAATRSIIQKTALNTFKMGCHEEVRIVVHAAKPATLAEATAVANESNLDSERVPSGINTFQHQRNGFRGSGYRRNYNSHGSRQNSFRQNSSRQNENRGNNSFRSNYGNGYRNNYSQATSGSTQQSNNQNSTRPWNSQPRNNFNSSRTSNYSNNSRTNSSNSGGRRWGNNNRRGGSSNNYRGNNQQRNVLAIEAVPAEPEN